MKQKSGEIRNPKLVLAMRKMASDNSPKNRSEMAEILMDSCLISPAEKEVTLLEKAGASTRVRFADIVNDKGEKYYLAFTDLDEYAKWNVKQKHNEALSMTMNDFGTILIRNINDLKGFVINPFGENVSITKQQLLSLLKQREAREKANKGN